MAEEKENTINPIKAGVVFSWVRIPKGTCPGKTKCKQNKTKHLVSDTLQNTSRGMDRWRRLMKGIDPILQAALQAITMTQIKK